MKNLKKRLTAEEFKEVYITNVLQHLSDNYLIASNQLQTVKMKFEKSYQKDSNHVLHFASDYWADFIAEAMELKRKTHVVPIK